MRKSVYIIAGNSEYRRMFEKKGYAIISHLAEEMPNLVCFTGGEDVTPLLYGEASHPFTYSSQYRDDAERKLFNQFVEASIPMVGICRGGQFLNVMNGGKMYQHVSAHLGSHLITDVASGEQLLATSTHHQMMRPGIAGKIVTTANQGGTKEHMKNGGICRSNAEEPDVEAVFYPHTQSLCFQPHPEFGSVKLQEYFFSLITTHLDI
jgi:gamma-glutamyl-gamma-aminobutyrate hydrolase PuuD